MTTQLLTQRIEEGGTAVIVDDDGRPVQGEGDG
jgi:hypothetical protein